MAAAAYALYFRDANFAPACELLRRICQPSSRSMPHVTVRYANADIPDFGSELYDDVVIDHMHIVAPGSFDYMASERSQLATVFVKCESDELERLSYKPDFPDSVFHITVYDGRPSAFASEVFSVMREFDWNFDVHLPDSLVEPVAKSEIPVGAKSPYLSQEATQLLLSLTMQSVSPDDLLRIPDSVRIELVRAVCVSLNSQMGMKRNAQQISIVREFPALTSARQEELWSLLELMEPTGEGRDRPFSAKHMSLSGLFLTPPEIADDIASAVNEYLSLEEYLDFGDPAIGSGIFLAALTGRVGRHRVRSAIGVEADRGRASLTASRWRHLGLEVNGDDFVDQVLLAKNQSTAEISWLASKRNLVIANPPYVRFQRLDPLRTRRWRDACAHQLDLKPDPRSDLYVYFVLACHMWLGDGAIAAWLLPTEFMFTNYGEILREYFSSEVELLRVHMYGDTSPFANARVASCVVVYRKRSPTDSQVRFTSDGTMIDPASSRWVSTSSLRARDGWARTLPTRPTSSPTTAPKIGDLFQVRRGIATGANDYFVLDNDKTCELEIPELWRKPVLPKAFRLKGAIIEADANGHPASVPFSWLIDCNAPIDAVTAMSPLFARYLKDIEPLVTRRELVRRRHPFYRQEANRPPRFVFTYMARHTRARDRFRLNRSRAVALNNYLCLYPKPRVLAWLDSSADNELLVLKVLNGLAGDEMRFRGREYADGLVKLEPRELRNLELEGLPHALLDSLLGQELDVCSAPEHHDLA